MRYFLVLEQSGGCDYTIGCGLSLEEIHAKSLEEAQETAQEEVGDRWQARNESGIEKASILVVEDQIDLGPLLTKLQNEKKAKEEAKRKSAQVTREKTQLARLKKKYPGV